MVLNSSIDSTVFVLYYFWPTVEYKPSNSVSKQTSGMLVYYTPVFIRFLVDNSRKEAYNRVAKEMWFPLNNGEDKDLSK